MPVDSRKTLYCDCHGLEGMAYRQNGRIVIMTKRHGKEHVLILNIAELLDTTPEPVLMSVLTT